MWKLSGKEYLVPVNQLAHQKRISKDLDANNTFPKCSGEVKSQKKSLKSIPYTLTLGLAIAS